MNLTPITRWLLIANIGVFVLQQLFGDVLLLDLGLWPLGERLLRAGSDVLGVGFAPWQLVTYGFLHGDVMHLALNMFGLVMFGPEIERLLGGRRFAGYWFTCLVVAGLTQIAVLSFGQGDFYPTVGASGAVYGLLAAGAMLFPQRELFLLFPPVEIKARTLALLMAAAELLHGVLGTLAGIAHFAHLGGMLGGVLLILYWRGRLAMPSARSRRRPSNYDRW